MALPSPVRQRNATLNLYQKVKLIREREINKLSVEKLKLLFKCGKTQVYDTLKRQDEIINQWKMGRGLFHRKKRKTRNEKLNDLILQWLADTRTKNLPISGPLIQAQAKLIAEEIGNSDFKASNGWLASFKNRHNINWNKSSSEYNQLNGNEEITIRNWVEENSSPIETTPKDSDEDYVKNIINTCMEEVSPATLSANNGGSNIETSEVVVKDWKDILETVIGEGAIAATKPTSDPVKAKVKKSKKDKVHKKVEDKVVENIGVIGSYTDALIHLHSLQEFSINSADHQLLRLITTAKFLVEKRVAVSTLNSKSLNMLNDIWKIPESKLQ